MKLVKPAQNEIRKSDVLAPRGLSDLSLYVTAVLIWGSTWLAITFQLGHVSPAVSVVWRFGLAAAILLGYAKWKRLSLAFGPREHFWIAVQGLTMFGINYIAVYLSEVYLASGLVAVISSSTAFFNIVAMRLFFTTRIEAKGMSGALLGISGVVLVFWHDLTRVSATGDALRGVGYAFLAVSIATLGTMAATRNQRAGVSGVPLSGWAMLYGALFVALFAALHGDPFTFDPSFAYVASLIYLALFGSVLAFGAYLTLMHRIGAHRSGYVAVAVPIVALLLSTVFESLQWQATMVVGIALCLAGNLLVLSRRKA